MKPHKKKRALFNPRYVSIETRKINVWALMFLFFQRFVVALGIVTDRSMLPTLLEGNTFLINKYIYHFRPPQRGEIVVLRPQKLSKEQYVKRVIGLPGEMISIQGGKVLINGQPLEEPYSRGVSSPDLSPQTLREDSYFVMGDNRVESEDSRLFGPIQKDQIEGKIKPGQWFSAS
jgi:signal peptidase I